MFDVRIRQGWHAAATMTSEYSVSRFPVALDQSNAYPWVAGESPGGFANEVDAIIDDTLDGTIGEIGDFNGTLYFAVASPGMIQHIRSELFPTDGMNEQLTLVFYQVGRGQICVQCWGRFKVSRPELAAEPQPGSGYVRRLRIEWDTGTLVAVGGGGSHNLSHNVSHDIGGIPE